MVVVEVLVWGLVAGLANSAAMVALYLTPWVKRIQAAHKAIGDAGHEPRPRANGFALQFLGTQVEVYIMTVGFAWLSPLAGPSGLAGALLLAVLFGALRVVAPVWALWVQGTYSRGYLAVEVTGGLLGSVVVVLTLYLLL
ncbi:hypothetical protein [Nocardia wallacei]|uniref:hypothetical protein n=1 Tax=Nocardia wallacei TaxID=480035 RepID=UPI002455B1B6|nr:hypothetical protein [Nocardia wallacei]